MTFFCCPAPACNRKYKTETGLRKHAHSIHQLTLAADAVLVTVEADPTPLALAALPTLPILASSTDSLSALPILTPLPPTRPYVLPPSPIAGSGSARTGDPVLTSLLAGSSSARLPSVSIHSPLPGPAASTFFAPAPARKKAAAKALASTAVPKLSRAAAAQLAEEARTSARMAAQAQYAGEFARVEAARLAALEEKVALETAHLARRRAALSDSATAGDDTGLCAICCDSPADTATIPCGHRNFCHPCISSYRESNPRGGCPTCRAAIEMVVRIFD